MKNTRLPGTIWILLTVTAFALVSYRAEEPRPALRFGGDGTFRIVQFTDLHWDDRSPLCDSTSLLIKTVIAAENPHLVVLTGDIVTAPPARDGWERIAAIMAEAEVPWTITLGNHDGEAGISRTGIFKLLSGKPFFMGEIGPRLKGAGNYLLEIGSADGAGTAAALYFLDSHSMPAAHKSGRYDWIGFDQTGWYRTTSSRLTDANGGSPLPSLMFFHIPLPEYKTVAAARDYTGNGGSVASADVNSGLFASLLEMQDVIGVFTGHDHANDFIGKHMDIALGYGRVSGYGAGSRLERGSRVIVLHEGVFGFDAWIRTLRGKEAEYFFPSGITPNEEAEADYLPATELNVTGQGVEYSYFEGRRFRHTSDISSATVLRRGTLPNISIDPATSQDSMAFIFTSWIRIPEKGVYNFYTYSDDGSVLYIDGQKVVDNDGGHSHRRRDGKVALNAGFHHLELHYFEDYMGQGLEVGWSGKTIREAVLPDYVLFIGTPRQD